MMRRFTSLGFVLASSIAVAGCMTAVDGAKSDGKEATTSDSGATLDGGPRSSAKAESSDAGLSFAPSNVPAAAFANATDDWIFNTATCGASQVTLDTTKGTVSCQKQPAGAFVFKSVTQ